MGKKVDSLDLKTPSEVIDITFDYSATLEIGETLVSSVVTNIVRKGTDATPTTMLVGSPSTDPSLVTQRIQGGISGCVYSLKSLATTSSGRVIELIGILPVRSLA